MQRYIIYYL